MLKLRSNYLLKNLFFFAIAVVLSVTGITMAQFLLIDRDVFSAEITELNRLNQRFSSELEPVVKRRFLAVDFLAATSYPATALSFHMEKEFAHLLEKFKAVNDVDNIVLFDASGALRAQSTIDPKFAETTKTGRWFIARTAPLFWYDGKILYLSPFFAADSGKISGYLGGIVSSDELLRHIKSTYRERSLSQARLSPEVLPTLSPAVLTSAISPLQMSASFDFVAPDVSLIPINVKTVILLMLLVGLSVGLFLFFLNRSLKTPLQELHTLMAAVSSDAPERIVLPHDSFFRRIGVEIVHMHEQRKKLESEMREREVSLRLTRAAAQVAHDIRSPLAALNIAVAELGGMPERTRLLIRNAAQRINDIATELLTHRKEIINSNESYPVSDEQASPVLLFGLLEDIVSEKRVEYQETSGIEIVHDSLPSNSTLFARVIPLEIKRALSNLINNSVEAISEQGRVVVELTQTNELALITVRDNGHGISPELLETILSEKGENYTDKGLGLGLQQAKQAAESVGGTLHIHSQPGQGTEVILQLPRVEPPSWFATALTVSEDSRVVVLDDDRSMHGFWEQRFEKLRQLHRGIQLVHFYHPDRLRGWWQGAQSSALPTIFLVDFELDDSDSNGLELVAELELAPQSVLVTSHHEDSAVLAQCAAMHMQIIPKSVVAYTPLRAREKEKPSNIPALDAIDAVLLDDEKLVRLSWQIMAEKHGVSLMAFDKSSDLLDRASSLPKQTPLYLDVHLNEPFAGLIVGRELARLGFETIILTTGLDADLVPQEPWITKIVGKTPPWRALS